MKRLLFLLVVSLCVVSVVYAAQKSVGRQSFTNNCDTLNDTVSGTGKAIIKDTIYFKNVGDADIVFGKLAIDASTNSNRGYGLSDSCWLYIYTDIFGTPTVLSQDSANAVPNTFTIKLTAGDTLFGENIYGVITVKDTTSDTVMTAKHDVRWEVYLR